MTILYINTGSSPNKGDGDTLRTAFNKINANFQELSAASILPSQTGNVNKYLKTDGTSASWSDLPATTVSQLTNGSAILTLSSTGTVTLPAGGTIVDSNGVSVFGPYDRLTKGGRSVVLETSGDITTPNGKIGSISTGSVLELYAQPLSLWAGINFDNNSLVLAKTDNVTIETNNSTPGTKRSWQFNSDGSTQFPGYKFPLADGSTGTVLTTDGLGTLSWVAPSGVANTGNTRFSSSTIYNVASQSIEIVSGLNDPIAGLIVPAQPNAINTATRLFNYNDGGVLISTYDHNWAYDKYGNLTLPAGGDILDSNGTSVLGGGVIQTSAAPVGNTSTLWYDTVGGRSYVYYDSGWVDASPMPVVDTTQLTNNGYSLSLDSAGVVNLPTFSGSPSIAIVQTASEGIGLNANGTYFNFNQNGSLTFPDGGRVVLHPYGNSYIESVDYGITTSTSSLNIFAGPDQKITLRANFGGTEKFWTFGLDGSLTWPDTSVQTGASISVTDLKTLVAASTSFEDFQARIAAL